MINCMHGCSVTLCAVVALPSAPLSLAQDPNVAAPASPRIESVVPLAKQPQQSDPNVIWYDDFDGPAKAYTESSGGVDANTAIGGAGASMLCLYEKGSQGKADRLTVGDPTGVFVGEPAGQARPAPGKVYYLRARQQALGGAWSDWGPWHQGFAVGD